MAGARAGYRKDPGLPVAAVVVAAALSCGGMAHGGEVYKWVDQNGICHFSDELPPSGPHRYKIIKQDHDSLEQREVTPAATPAKPEQNPREAYEKMDKPETETGYPAASRGTPAPERRRVRADRERKAFRKLDEASVGDGLKTLLDKKDWKGAERRLAKGEDPNTDVPGYKMPLLHVYSMNGDIETAKFLVAHGADVNALTRGRKTPLLLALERDRLELAALLVEDGAWTRGPELDGKIVHYMMNGKPEAARFLIKHGGDVDAATVLGTPLQNAIRIGRKDIVEELLAEGADIEHRDRDGWTPLMFAAVVGNRGIVEFLVENGAEVGSRNSRSQTAAMIATEAGWTEIAAYLNAQLVPR